MSEDFDHRLPLDRIRDGDRIDLAAGDSELRSIAERLGLMSLGRLEAHASLEREGDQVRARGRVRASLEQSCVATGEPVPEHVDEAFDLMFVPEPEAAAASEEIELAEDDCETLFYDGGTIDIGSAIADTLALSINPYPRSPNAESALREAGVITEEQASPFAVLAKLKTGGADS